MFFKIWFVKGRFEIHKAYILTKLSISLMKHINIVFEDEEYDKLIKRKKEQTWHDYIIEIKE